MIRLSIFTFSLFAIFSFVCLAAWSGAFRRSVRAGPIVIPPSFAQTASAAQAKADWTLRPNGVFNALYGSFAERHGRLHVYSELTRIMNDKTGRKEATPDNDELKPSWRGEPSYHEVYALVDGAWVQQRREFFRPPYQGQEIDLGHCDQRDLRNIPIEKQMIAELPASIKIKAVHKFPAYATVLYTNASQQSDSAFAYPPLELDLLVPDRGGWKIADSQEVDEYGYFCGTKTLSTQLANGESTTVLLVFTADPSVDNEYYTANSFIVRRNAPQRPEKRSSN